MNHLIVITAGMGSPSTSRMLGDRLAAATVAGFGGGVTPRVEVVELRDLAVDLAHLYTSRVPSPRLQEAFDLVKSASGVIAVSPVLNGSMNGLFKLFFDLLEEGAMAGRPVLLAATGGTARHSLAIEQSMLPMFFYLKAVVEPTAVFAATADWGAGSFEGPARGVDGARDSGLVARIDRAGSDFAALVTARPGSTFDGFADVPDFESLLGLS